jgi:hypothetical protein
MELAKKTGAISKAVSAKEGTGIEEIFEELAIQLIQESTNSNKNKNQVFVDY